MKSKKTTKSNYIALLSKLNTCRPPSHKPVHNRLMTCICLLANAVNASKTSLHADIAAYTKQVDKFNDEFNAYKQYYANSIEDYLAQFIIECMKIDLMLGLELSEGYEIADKMLLAYPTETRDFISNAWQLNKAIIGGPIFKEAMYIKCLNMIRYVEIWCQFLNIDIWHFVKARIAYMIANKTN